MNRLSIPAVLLVLCGVLCAEDSAIEHRFLAVDNGGNRLFHVNQSNPEANWTIDIPSGSRDLQLVGTDAVLVSHGNGCGEYDLASGKRTWAVSDYKKVSSARRLPNGNTLLAASIGGVTLIEIDRNGKRVSSLALGELKDQRLIRRLPEALRRSSGRPEQAEGESKDAHVLLSLAGPRKLVEIDARGKTVWDASLPGKGYVAVRLPGGNTLATTGGACTVVELDAEGKIVSTVGGKKAHPRARLLWFSGMDRLPNGNVVVANWNGHGNVGKGPDIVEFSPKNKLTWQWESKEAKSITNVLVLDGLKAPEPKKDAEAD